MNYNIAPWPTTKLHFITSADVLIFGAAGLAMPTPSTRSGARTHSNGPCGHGDDVLEEVLAGQFKPPYNARMNSPKMRLTSGMLNTKAKLNRSTWSKRQMPRIHRLDMAIQGRTRDRRT